MSQANKIKHQNQNDINSQTKLVIYRYTPRFIISLKKIEKINQSINQKLYLRVNVHIAEENILY